MKEKLTLLIEELEAVVQVRRLKKEDVLLQSCRIVDLAGSLGVIDKEESKTLDMKQLHVNGIEREVGETMAVVVWLMSLGIKYQRLWHVGYQQGAGERYFMKEAVMREKEKHRRNGGTVWW